MKLHKSILSVVSGQKGTNYRIAQVMAPDYQPEFSSRRLAVRVFERMSQFLVMKGGAEPVDLIWHGPRRKQSEIYAELLKKSLKNSPFATAAAMFFRPKSHVVFPPCARSDANFI